MCGRRVLIIGSQSQRLNRLSFLPEVAVRIHALMTHPGPGECLGAAVGDPPGLLLDPTVTEAKNAIIEAYEAAACNGETLILAYIGHGEFAHGDFFLMPTDATYTGDALDLAQIIKHRSAHPNGLIVLLDTCYSGTGAFAAVENWCRSLEGQLEFEVLTASDDGLTANAWFTRSLIHLLERGDPTAPDQLCCEDARAWVMKDHPQIRPQHAAYNRGSHLRLSRNSSKVPGDVFWRDSPGRIQILERTAYFQPTAGLAEIIQASECHRSVLLMGETGAGKSSLAAALARPEITRGHVQSGFVHAVGMLSVTTTIRVLAVDLEHQLRRTVAGFTKAVEEFQRRVSPNERERLDFLNGMVLHPLHYLVGQPVVRIVLDGLDQLSDHTRRRLRDELEKSPDNLRLIMTARDDTPDCPDAYVILVHGIDREVLNEYLAERGIPKDAHGAILDRSEHHWLVTKLLADAVLEQPLLDLDRLPGTVNEAYALRLDQAGAEADWRNRFGPILGPLAVAGAGPVLPLRAAGACERCVGRTFRSWRRNTNSRHAPWPGYTPRSRRFRRSHRLVPYNSRRIPAWSRGCRRWLRD